jgi:hypothetical protein
LIDFQVFDPEVNNLLDYNPSTNVEFHEQPPLSVIPLKEGATGAVLCNDPGPPMEVPPGHSDYTIHCGPTTWLTTTSDELCDSERAKANRRSSLKHSI